MKGYVNLSGMTEFTLPGAADVVAAAARIAPHATVTPVLRSRELDDLTAAQLHFKCEHLQRSGAFKFRGASNAVWSLSEDAAAAGVVTHSSGNHGAALALAARVRGIACHVVVPEGALASKLGNIARHAGVIWRCQASQASRDETCARVQRETGATLVHPYADAQVIAGQGTAALELVGQLGGDVDVLVVPVGGGGLAAGTLLALRHAAPDCELVLAEPSGAADAARSLSQGHREKALMPDTVCDGLRAVLGEPNFALLNGHADVITVTDAQSVAAMRLLWQELKQTVEPSSAVVLAAVLAQPARFAGRRVGLVLSGGNVDLDALPWGQP